MLRFDESIGIEVTVRLYRGCAALEHVVTSTEAPPAPDRVRMISHTILSRLYARSSRATITFVVVQIYSATVNPFRVGLRFHERYQVTGTFKWGTVSFGKVEPSRIVYLAMVYWY